MRGVTLLLVATLAAACGPAQETRVASVCEATGDLLRRMAQGLSADLADEEISAAVYRVVAESESTDSAAMREAAQRLEAAWERAQANGEAAPDDDFGRAANDLAEACVDRGFAFPDVGFD